MVTISLTSLRGSVACDSSSSPWSFLTYSSLIFLMAILSWKPISGNSILRRLWLHKTRFSPFFLLRLFVYFIIFFVFLMDSLTRCRLRTVTWYEMFKRTQWTEQDPKPHNPTKSNIKRNNNNHTIPESKSKAKRLFLLISSITKFNRKPQTFFHHQQHLD